MTMMWSIETDAVVGAAMDITRDITGTPSWSQSGRLGTEATTDHATALAVVAALHEAGHRAWMSPAHGHGSRRVAEEQLAAYAVARDGLVEAVHAGLEAGMRKTEIARLSGLSRPGLDKIIDRFGLDALVKGE
jgi:hypothetical protein